MKRKYYLRGIGIGIIFASIIMSIGYHTSDKNKLTEEKIIEKAKELGMVFEEENSKIDQLLSTITPSPTPEKEDSTGETSSEETTEETSTEDESANEEQEALTPTKEPEKEPTKGAKVETKEKQEVSQQDETQDQMVSVKITYGMSSEGVSKLLKSMGIIEDSDAFNQYLILNKYTKDIGTGIYELKPSLSYKEIADIIILKYQKNN